MAQHIIDPATTSEPKPIMGMMTDKTRLSLSKETKTLKVHDNKEKSGIHQIHFFQPVRGTFFSSYKNVDLTLLYLERPYFAGKTMKAKFDDPNYFNQVTPEISKKIAEKSYIQSLCYKTYYEGWVETLPRYQKCLRMLEGDNKKMEKYFVENYGQNHADSICQIFDRDVRKILMKKSVATRRILEKVKTEPEVFEQPILQPQVA